MSVENLLVKKEFFCNIDVPVFVKNTEGIYTYCNKAFLELIGASEHQVIGYKVNQIVSRKFAQEHERVDQILLKTSGSQRYSVSIGSGGSIYKKIIFNKSILYDQNCRVGGIICAITDDVVSIATRASVVKKLTSRELDVLRLLLVGKSTKAIALELGISVHTAGGYMKSLYLKLGAHSKNEAMYKAISIYGMALNESDVVLTNDRSIE